MKLTYAIMISVLVQLNAQRQISPEMNGAFPSPAVGVTSTEDMADLKTRSYPEMGLVTSLTPVIPTVGYWFGPYGVRVAGIYLGEDAKEAHLNLGYKLVDNGHKRRSINILMSKTVGSDPGSDYDFASIGLAFGMTGLFRVKGLFVELGLAKVVNDNLGNVRDELFIPCGHVGYIFRLTPE